MLSAADNEALTRTGPGTPMGRLFRRYWVPALLSQELPTRDGPPVRVRLLGEDLIAFRESSGAVGLVEPVCPHRGANLFFGRNEEGGLRCVFHGWKFDVAGRCLDQPNLPRDAKHDTLRQEIGITAYPTREAGGFIWAYLGPADAMPALPEMEFTLLPPARRFVSKKLQECNWAQSCEGGLDTAHFSFLHMSVGNNGAEALKVMGQSEAAASGDPDRVRWLREDGVPRFSIIPHEAGLTLGAARKADGDRLYWRISQFLMPNHALAPSTFPGENYHGQSWVPIDDHSCWIYCYTWNPDRDLSAEECARFRAGHTVHATVDENWVPLRRRANDYLIDRDEQKHRSFTGITGVSEQDACIQDSQGLIADRTREHLGPTDLGIVRFRRLMLTAARQLAAGVAPPSAAAAAGYRVRAGGTVAPAATPLAEVMVERFGHVHGLIEEVY